MAQTTGEPVKLAEGFQFCEGPAYERGTGYLYVVNCQSDNIHRVYPDGRVEVFAKAPGSGNGSTFAKDGTLWVCDYKRKAIVRFDRSGKPEVMAEECEGKPFLGPNDLCCILPTPQALGTDPSARCTAAMPMAGYSGWRKACSSLTASL